MTFRMKIVLAMLLVVFLVTGATVFAIQKSIRSAYNGIIRELFRVQITVFREKQQLRLETVKEECRKLAESVRLFAALEEDEAEIIYQTAGDELRSFGGRYSFYRLLDAGGEIIPVADSRAGMIETSVAIQIAAQLAGVSQHLSRIEQRQQLGYLALTDSSGERKLHEVVLTRITNASGRLFGAVILGFPVTDFGGIRLGSHDSISSGILVDGHLYSGSIPESQRQNTANALIAQITSTPQAPENAKLSIGQTSYRVDYTLLNPGSEFPAAYQASLYSLESMLSHERGLISLIVIIGAVAMLGAFMVSLFLAHGLSVPIRELVRGTVAIREGDLKVRVLIRSQDEIGQLAASFNEMTEGLALKERYRHLLNVVSDKEVAAQLTQGTLALGGETRDVSILFCDIRDFTSITENMDPVDVVRMLNEHMTTLTKVVYEHQGVVDKFVGDLIMAVFGAPKSYGQDSVHAVHCARRMIEEREALNRQSEYRLQVGIGVASGPALAGCMGSSDRLNYTVLGERVNLASRLCGKAGVGQVVVDQTTYDRVFSDMSFARLDPLELKGFRDPVPAYCLLGIGA